MAQRKNSVVLSSTAIARLQKLVDTGEYCSIDDAANHLILSIPGSTQQYSPVLPPTEPKKAAEAPKPDSTNNSSPLAAFASFDF